MRPIVPAVLIVCVCACSASTATSPPGSDTGVARDTGGQTTDGGALPEIRTDLSCAESIAIDGNPTCVVLRDHTLWCAGGNFDGALGVGVADEFFGTRGGFVQVASLGAEVASVALGSTNRVCAIKRDASLWCWGNNPGDYLGLGSSNALFVPTRAKLLDSVAQVLFGPFHSCARKTDGSIWCWGNVPGASESSQPIEMTAAGRDAVQLAVGAGFNCIRKGDGTVWCWGQNTNGEIGQGTLGFSKDPVQLIELGTDVAELAAGGNHACAAKTDGSVWCWGWNRFGEAGPGLGEEVLVATKVSALTAKIVQLELDTGASCGRADDGKVFCWGDSFGSGLGGSSVSATSATPATAPQGPAAQVISEGHAGCVTRTDGAVRCWGSMSLVPKAQASAGLQIIAPCK